VTGRTLADVALDPPTRVHPGATLQSVAAIMEDAQLSCVLVGDGMAIITEHDVAIALASGQPADSPVDRVGTRTPMWATLSSTLVDAVGMMATRGVRHLPVLSADGAVSGVLALTTATAALLEDTVGRPGSVAPMPAPDRPPGGAPRLVSPTIETIAVGFDGSPDSEAAVWWAGRLARQIGATVVVVHAVGLLEHVSAPASSSLDSAGPDVVVAARRILSDVGLSEESVQVVVDDGDPCSVMLRATMPGISADLLVVGSRGKRVHSGQMLGSTSLQLAERTTVPLVVVPPHTTQGPAG
jgi:nucleotide-binding universal stress UspA family protein/CBS domain-containing protein